MLALIVTTRNGEVREVAGAAGVSAMQVIRDHGFDDLLALCGGLPFVRDLPCSCRRRANRDIAADERGRR